MFEIHCRRVAFSWRRMKSRTSAPFARLLRPPCRKYSSPSSTKTSGAPIAASTTIAVAGASPRVIACVSNASNSGSTRCSSSSCRSSSATAPPTTTTPPPEFAIAAMSRASSAGSTAAGSWTRFELRAASAARFSRRAAFMHVSFRDLDRRRLRRGVEQVALDVAKAEPPVDGIPEAARLQIREPRACGEALTGCVCGDRRAVSTAAVRGRRRDGEDTDGVLDRQADGGCHVDLSGAADVDREPVHRRDLGDVQRREDLGRRGEPFGGDRERLCKPVGGPHPDDVQAVGLDVPELLAAREHPGQLGLDEQAETLGLALGRGRAAGADLDGVREAECPYLVECALERRRAGIVDRPHAVELWDRHRRADRPEVAVTMLEAAALERACKGLPRGRERGVQAIRVLAHRTEARG